MLRPLRYIGYLFLLFIGTVEYGYSRTLSSLDSTDGSEELIDTSLSKDHLNSLALIDLPLRSLPGLALTLPTAYADKDGLHLYNTNLGESNFIVDGMQIRYADAFPYRAIRQIHDYSLITPIGVGNALNLIGVGTECNLDTGYISIELAADFRFYSMTSDYPIESKSGQTYFYPYGSDLIALDAGGPFKIGKRTGSVFLAVNLAKQNEQSPSSINTYQVKQSVLTDLQNNPLRPSGFGSGSFENAKYVSAKDIEQSRYSSNAGIKGVNTYLRVEFPFTDKIKLVLGSYVNVSKSRQFIYENSMFNAENNPEVITRNFDNYGQLSHTLVEKESMKLSYKAQVTYSNYYKKVQSAVHEDAVFRYGYLGKFNTYTTNSYEFGIDSMTGLNGNLHNGYTDTLYTFDPGGYNPVAENVTTDYYNMYSDPTGHYENRMQVQDGGGLVNGYVPGLLSNNVYGVWNSPGAVYDLFAIKNEEVLRGKGLFELVRGQHAFHLGFEVTRQVERSYMVNNPVGLWRQMGLLTNVHILQLDILNPELQLVYDPISGTYVFPEGGFIDYPRLYDGDSQTTFDKNLREELGMAVNSTEWIDLNSLPLETFSLDMFSPDELLNNGSGFVSYYGYDYLGNKLDHSDAALDYYSAVDEEGNYKRNVGAYQPSSGAAYLDYGFEGKNLKFSIELRADYFNSNQPVLKDKFSLYEIRTVSEVSGTLNSSGSHPSGVGENFAVYVDDITNPTQILGYRNEDQWYNDAGQEISNASPLITSSGVVPYLVNPMASLADAFKNSSAVVHYFPQVAIVYEIGSGVSVFASHSAATQNPRIINVFRPEQYMNIQNTSTVVNNPAMHPLRTAKVKVGFGQKIANLSTIELYGYRIEFEEVQITKIIDAYPVTYSTYDVFASAVNGITLSIKHGATRNIGFKTGINLSLQVGASSTSNIGKTANGYLQYNFGDRRHYKGFTTQGGKQPMRDIGIGLFFHLNDGNKYSRIRDVYPEGFTPPPTYFPVLDGTINGSQMSPTAFVHLKIEKRVELTKLNSRLDFYLMVQNLLNRKNIYSVYSYTGNPSDDGYLTDPGAQAGINSQNDPEAFRMLYALKVDDPRNYNAPRVIRLGAVFNF